MVKVCGKVSDHLKIDLAPATFMHMIHFLCVCVYRPSGLSGPGCSGGGCGLPPVFARSDG